MQKLNLSKGNTIEENLDILYNKYINNESKAWWVLPIDDDEFLYISNKYENNITKLILTLDEKYKMNKVSFQWRNMFPFEYTKTRNKSFFCWYKFV